MINYEYLDCYDRGRYTEMRLERWVISEGGMFFDFD